MVEPTPEERLHIEALVWAFVLRRYRDRLLVKPGQVVGEFCHVLPDKLDARFVLALGGVVKSPAAAVALVQRMTDRKTAHLLTAWTEPDSGEYPLAEAVELVESSGASAASIEPGEVVYCKTEGCPKGDSYLLVRDSRRLQLARRLIEEMKK